jgi:hypothetical protein
VTASIEVHSALKRRVRSQRTELPGLYGDVDFDLVPERLVLDPEARAAAVTTTSLRWDDAIDGVFDDTEAVELMRTCTMLGDVVADAYAALLPEYGLPRLIKMLRQACRDGVDTVEDAPPQLGALLADMERVPEWIDMRLVAEGARQDRVFAALLAPYIVRGAFLATFMNKYAALPMALTGALSGKRSAHRVLETATFFSSTVTPGGLDRHGPGFEAAAMVRLMHSMVRFNALRRSAKWDVEVYGIPIPQVDQMPAGLIQIFLLAERVLASGRQEFTPAERARVELSRYRCFLLGLPAQLLPDTPAGIQRIMLARHATLRPGFDDATCGQLIRATMAADLRPDSSVRSRLFGIVERSWSREYFRRNFAGGSRATARDMGVNTTRRDQLTCLATAPFVVGRLLTVVLAGRFPLTRGLADRYVVRVLRRRLAGYGHAEFTTDHNTYAGQPR